MKIEETEFEHGEDEEEFSGFIITTNKQVIKLGISAYPVCCEKYGYLVTNDTLKSFLNSTILSIDLVDTELVAGKLESVCPKDEFKIYYNTMFINISTDVGTLQFTAYNHHDGDYGHKSVLVSKELSAEKEL